MTVEVMSKLEEYLDEQADMTMSVMKDRLLSDLVVDVASPLFTAPFTACCILW
ncbi:hypothetical protein PI124_g13059 [Phytophthora idaei]|nr:hypothetical protein PI125_g6310 [Phytophthora idaei]KAG3127875.1 hypothetical protein PI126_g21659 [Phytophthora idaei]KAG3242087.1 hypothetical protein PI124_g13059 [Phytophthora idaei]